MIKESDLFDATMQNLSIDTQNIRQGVEKRLAISNQYTGNNLRIAPLITEIFRYAMNKALSDQRQTIEPNDISFVLSADKYNQYLKTIVEN
jgi:hypothetical protein